MKVVTAAFLLLMLVASLGCELSQPPAVRPTAPLQRSDNMEVAPGETDSPFRLLEGFQVFSFDLGDQVAWIGPKLIGRIDSGAGQHCH